MANYLTKEPHPMTQTTNNDQVTDAAQYWESHWESICPGGWTTSDRNIFMAGWNARHRLTSKPAPSDLVEAVAREMCRRQGMFHPDEVREKWEDGREVFAWQQFADDAQESLEIIAALSATQGQASDTPSEGQGEHVHRMAARMGAKWTPRTPTAPQPDRESVLREAATLNIIRTHSKSLNHAIEVQEAILALVHPTPDTQSDAADTKKED